MRCVERLAARLLRRHIGDGAHRRARRGELVHADGRARASCRRVDSRLPCGVSFARPKSRILACPRLRDEDIGRLDVAMDDAAGVRGVERVGDLDADLQQLFHFERPARDLVLEGRRRPETPWR